jgi:hypothetical protein
MSNVLVPVDYPFLFSAFWDKRLLVIKNGRIVILSVKLVRLVS